MTSVVEIANMGLGNLGAKNISSLSEVGAEAEAAQLYYATARDATLEAHDWGFARKIQALAKTANTPLDTKWGYEYAYPSDCLKMRAILPTASYWSNEWERGLSADGYQVIWTNIDGAYGRYTKRVTDSSLFSAELVEAISWKLASMMCMKLLGKADVKQACEQQYAYLISLAMAGNLSEEYITPQLNNEFINARL